MAKKTTSNQPVYIGYQTEEELAEIKLKKERRMAESLGWNAWIKRESTNTCPYEEGSELQGYWFAGFNSAKDQYSEMREIVSQLHLLSDGVNPTTHFSEPKKRARPRIRPERDLVEKPKRKYNKKVKINE